MFSWCCHAVEITEESVANEALHLTAAMQYCGFWSVETSAMLHLQEPIKWIQNHSMSLYVLHMFFFWSTFDINMFSRLKYVLSIFCPLLRFSAILWISGYTPFHVQPAIFLLPWLWACQVCTLQWMILNPFFGFLCGHWSTSSPSLQKQLTHTQ